MLEWEKETATLRCATCVQLQLWQTKRVALEMRFIRNSLSSTGLSLLLFTS